MATLPRNKIGVREPLDNRAVWPVIAVTMVGQMCEGVAHVGQLSDAAIEFGDMFQGDSLYFGACTRAVMP